MTPLWTSEAAAASTRGRATTNWQASGISIDTRTLRRGDLFVALRAARDGHDFVAEALEKGAAAAMVTHRPKGVSDEAPLLVVSDVQAALEDLGRAARARTRARVAAITGSVGKTSTKEMLRAALAGQGRVHAAEASYNNHWGVPLTLARMPADTDYAIIEIGMNHPGEIAPLARLTRPDVVMVTTIAPAHLEAFADLGGIATEKGAICEGLGPGGVAVLKGDLPGTLILRAAARRAGARSVTFGTGRDHPYRLRDIVIQDHRTVAQGNAEGAPVLLELASEGRHFAMNALGALAVADALGADRTKTLAGLAQWVPPPGRGTREALVLEAGGQGARITLIDDAFNANPVSLAAALEMLAAGPRGSGRRRVAILGDMLELGPTEAEMHAALADDPSMRALDLVHCVGPRMRHLWQALPAGRRGQWCATAEELAARIGALLEAGDVVLVKGSKGSRVSLVVDAIRKLGHRTATSEQEA